MTLEQATILGILVAMLALFAWDRIRYDVVALAALLAAVASGVVEPKHAFQGFSDDIVVIVGSALVLSAAVSRSGVVEALVRPLAPYMKGSAMQITLLGTAVALLSAFMKNIGALAIFMPIAFQVARGTHKSASRLLMPLSFSALLGGMMTLIGTSPNIIVSRLREASVGEPFGMFDFLPVGLPLTLVGIGFLAFAWRLLPGSRGAGTTPETLFSVADYQAEVRLPAGSPLVGKTVGELEALAQEEATVTAIIREHARRYIPAAHWVLFEDDILVLQCDAHALARLVKEAKLELLHDKRLEAGAAHDKELVVVEAVITPDSVLIRSTAEQLRLRDRYGVNLLAVGRSGARIGSWLRRVRFQAGDLVVLRMPAEEMSERLAALGCLPLAERKLELGRPRYPYLAPAILAVAMLLAATGTVSVAIAFFGAAVLVVLLGALGRREAYAAVEWPILALLGALIPISDALRRTGATDLIAEWLSRAAGALPPTGALALMLIAAMAVTPFLNNAATVLVMAPIAVSFAHRLGLQTDPFLMAVAVGAACDFLTPIGHQCNTLVMGPGGYRFGDYWRLGLPLSLIVVVLGTALIRFVWPPS